MTSSASPLRHGARQAPAWFWAVSGLGLVWNAYGLYQFAGSFSQTADRLMASGMTAAQAELYLGLPAWLSVAFGIGVLGGLAGCGLLLARRAAALPVLMASFLGYIGLFAGDVGHGVFAGIPAQLTILLVVLLVAAALLVTAWAARRRRLIV